MLDFFTSVTESQSYNNFSMKEKTPIAKLICEVIWKIRNL